MTKQTRLTETQQQELIAEYLDGYSVAALAKKYGMTAAGVWAVRKRHGIPTRYRRSLTVAQEKELLRRYCDGENIEQLIREFKIERKTLSNIRRRYNVPRRAHWEWRGEKHWNYTDGRIVHASGYVSLLVDPVDPMYPMNRRGYVLEHRLVMARKLGRVLTSDESVHHINGDKADNRVENLQLRQRYHGKGHVSECADCGSDNIIQKQL